MGNNIFVILKAVAIDTNKTLDCVLWQIKESQDTTVWTQIFG